MTAGRLLLVSLLPLFGVLLASAEGDPSIHYFAEDESSQYRVDLIEDYDNRQINEVIGNSSMDMKEIIHICKAFLKEYATQSSNFTRCLVENARPFRFCETCVGPYKKASTLYSDMQTGDHACKKLLLLADRVQVVRMVNKNMETIWESAFCNDCFASIGEDETNGTVHYTLTNETSGFLALFDNMTSCLNTTIQDLAPFVTLQCNSSCCDKCRTDYRSLNEHFTSMLKDSDVCMDVVDMMNYTRLLWSKSLNCTHRQGDLAPVLVITGVICALPVIFYIANRLIRPRTERTIVIQRRMKFPHTNSYGSMSDSQQTLVNSNSQNESSSNQIPR